MWICDGQAILTGLFFAMSQIPSWIDKSPPTEAMGVTRHLIYETPAKQKIKIARVN